MSTPIFDLGIFDRALFGGNAELFDAAIFDPVIFDTGLSQASGQVGLKPAVAASSKVTALVRASVKGPGG